VYLCVVFIMLGHEHSQTLFFSAHAIVETRKISYIFFYYFAIQMSNECTN